MPHFLPPFPDPHTTEPFRLTLKGPAGSNVQLVELDPTCAVKPFALAGRTPVPPSPLSPKQPAMPLAITVPSWVQDQVAPMDPSPLQVKLQVYCRSKRAAVAASGRADGAVRALRSLQAASRAAASSRLPVMRVVLIVPPIRSHWRSQGPHRTPGAEDLQRLTSTVPREHHTSLPGSPGGGAVVIGRTCGNRSGSRAVGVHHPDLAVAGRGVARSKGDRSAVGGPHDARVPLRAVGDVDRVRAVGVQ